MIVKGAYSALQGRTHSFTINNMCIDIVDCRITISVMNKPIGYGCIYDTDHINTGCLNKIAQREFERQIQYYMNDNK